MHVRVHVYKMRARARTDCLGCFSASRHLYWSSRMSAGTFRMQVAMQRLQSSAAHRRTRRCPGVQADIISSAARASQDISNVLPCALWGTSCSEMMS